MKKKKSMKSPETHLRRRVLIAIYRMEKKRLRSMIGRKRLEALLDIRSTQRDTEREETNAITKEKKKTDTRFLTIYFY